MARGIWKGTLSFGLVSIGVELLTAESPERLDLDMIDKRDMGRIGYQRINKSTGEEVSSENIVKGYAVSKGKYVILEDEDIKAANPKASQTIDIMGFVDFRDIPPMYFAKPYIIAPTKGSEKAYVLFRDVLRDSDRVAVAQVVIRTRQYMCAVYPWDDALAVQLLRYDAEIRKPDDVGVSIPKTAGRAVRPEEMSMAKRLVDSMEMKWKPETYKDEYRNDLLKMIQQRAKKGVKEVAAESPEAPEETKVIDLMAALRRSVGASSGDEGAKKSHAKAAKRAPARRSTRKSA